MSKLAIPVLLTAFLFGLFIFGTMTQQVFPMMSAFCLWTPVAWFTGYSFARIGIRVHISTSTQGKPLPEIVPMQQRSRRERSRQLTDFQE